VLAVLQNSTYRKHVEGPRDKLAIAMSHCGARLRGAGLTPWENPRAGMFATRAQICFTRRPTAPI